MLSHANHGAIEGDDSMATKVRGYQAIHIYAASVRGPAMLDMGVTGRRPMRFKNLKAARRFADSFDVDRLTVQVGRPIPPADAIMRW